MEQYSEIYLCHIYPISFLLPLLLEPKDGGSMSFRNVDLYQNAWHKYSRDSTHYSVGCVYERKFTDFSLML
jgi:hypothetical protein